MNMVLRWYLQGFGVLITKGTTRFVVGNGHIWRILGERTFSKCSHINYMLRFFESFFAQPALKSDRSLEFQVRTFVAQH